MREQPRPEITFRPELSAYSDSVLVALHVVVIGAFGFVIGLTVAYWIAWM